MKFKKLSSALLAVTMIFSSSALVTANAQTTDSLSSYKMGDINFDGVISPEDVVKLHDYILGDYTPDCSETEILAIADINKDGVVNRADIDKYIDGLIYAHQHLGDVDGDGELTVIDATEIQKYVAHLTPYLDFGKVLSSDLDSDNEITVIDATEIQKNVAHIDNVFDNPKDNYPTYPTAQMIADDKKYRAEYGEDIAEIKQAGKFSFDNVYVVARPGVRSEVFVRDKEWCYAIDPVSGIQLWGRYNSLDDTAILPTDLNGYPISFVSEFFCEEDLFPGPDYSGVNSIKTLIIPADSNIKYVGYRSGCFGNLSSLKNVFFQKGVTSDQIAGSMFWGCPKLERVIWPSSATDIPDNMFRECSSLISLKHISIPETVNTIYDNAFLASGLTDVVVPANITSIGREAFGWIPADTVTFLSKSPSLKIDQGALNLSPEEIHTKKITVYGYKASGYSSYVNEKMSNPIWEYEDMPYIFKYL